jgi:hypothetical protein
MPSNIDLESDESILPAPIYNQSGGYFAHVHKPSSGRPAFLDAMGSLWCKNTEAIKVSKLFQDWS